MVEDREEEGKLRKNMGKQGQWEGGSMERKDGNMRKREGCKSGKGGPLTHSPISLTFTVRERIHDLLRDIQHPGLSRVYHPPGWNDWP